MSTTSAMHGRGDSFTYPFEDPEWGQKLLIPVLLMLANFLIPVIPAFFLSGYGLEIMRGIILGDGQPALPPWRDWGRLFVDGLMVFLIGLLYMLPVIVFSLLGFGLIFLPTLLVGISSSGQEEVNNLVMLIPLLSTLGGVLVLGTAVVLSIVLAIMFSFAIVHYSVNRRFAAAFAIGDWWKIVRANFTDFLIAFAIILVISILSGLLLQLLSLTVVLCLVIPILQSVVSVYTLFVSSALFAQAYRGGMQKLENQP